MTEDEKDQLVALDFIYSMLQRRVNELEESGHLLHMEVDEKDQLIARLQRSQRRVNELKAEVLLLLPSELQALTSALLEDARELLRLWWARDLRGNT